MSLPRIIDLPKLHDPRGNLTFVEENEHVPFSIKRVFWIYDVPGGEVRGGHAYKTQEEFIIALSGSLDVVVKSRTEVFKFQLNRSYFGLYIPSGYWRHMENFSTNSVSLVLSSSFYTEEDYIREDVSYFGRDV